VDVLATLPEAGKIMTDSRSAIVLLQKILVLAVGLDTKAQAVGVIGTAQQNANNFQREMVLTLSLNLQEAQLLSLASEKGRLSVALRNPEDQRVVEGVPDLASSSLLDAKTRN